MIKQNAIAHTATRRLVAWFTAIRLKTLYTINPTTAVNTKKPNILRVTIAGLTELSPIADRMLNTTIPIISSIMAAESSVAPTLVFSLPISFSVSTVILTEVAAKTIPTNAAFIKLAYEKLRVKKSQ